MSTLRSPLWLLLAMVLLGIGCVRSASGPADSDRAQARKLFGQHREALPRFATSIPFPQEEKYWRYAADLEFPDQATLIRELTEGLAQVELGEQALRAAMLRELDAPVPEAIAAALDAAALAVLQAADDPEQPPPATQLGRWLLARYPSDQATALQQVLQESGVYSEIDPSVSIEAPGLAFEDFLKAAQDFRRFRLANLCAVERSLKGVMPHLRVIATEGTNAPAFRLEAARTLYALGDRDQRPLLLYLAFGNAEQVPLYGWPTFAFLAEQQDPALYETIKERITAAPPGLERGQYLVHLAAYGKPEDLPQLAEWALELVPRLPPQRIGPSADVRPSSSLRPQHDVQLAPAIWRPDQPLLWTLTQDAPSPEEPPVADPHAGLSDEDFAQAFGYEPDDVQTALRLRSLRAFTPESGVLRIIHEALLKGGPAARTAAGELLAVLGTAESQGMLKLLFAEEQEPAVLAELAYAWLMIDRRVEREQ